MSSAGVVKILFVCTGNICRSPTAEGVFRHLAQDAGLGARFHIDSAGTDSYHIGEGPDRRAVKIAARHGVSLAGQRARALKPEDFNTFDYLYAMDGGHFFDMQSRAPSGHTAKVEMFLAAAGAEGQDVPDPWYGNEADFENVFDMVHSASQTLLEKLRKAHGI
ncbi:MAG: low molecular weight phosphotyrosine protein phosphatase [Alphaproteobacteria bacterium]|nr:low molecular weight phosphotyrosine protein phosphatase [Alphaproteobacteria bacterium]